MKKAFVEEIYYILEALRSEPFLNVQLPDFIDTVREVHFTNREPTPSGSFVKGTKVVVNDRSLLDYEPTKYDRFDVAFSLAHEQYKYVDAVFEELKRKAPYLNVFYYRDEGQEIKLWGRNMFPYLQTVYRDLSDHVVIFVSSDYVNKRWARHEWRSVQEAILDREEEYVLPARFDNTKLPGLHETIHYIDLSRKTPETFATMIIAKISSVGKKPDQ